jgi:predicted nucleic acid-binding protein
MKTLFFDTNVVMDLYLDDRAQHIIVKNIFHNALSNSCTLACAWHTLSVLEYTGRKHLKGEIFNVLRNVVDLFEILAVGSLEARQAFQYLNGDYEDAMQIVSALKADADVILTADISGGFEKSPIPVMTPNMYLDTR